MTRTWWPLFNLMEHDRTLCVKGSLVMAEVVLRRKGCEEEGGTGRGMARGLWEGSDVCVHFLRFVYFTTPKPNLLDQFLNKELLLCIYRDL